MVRGLSAPAVTDYKDAGHMTSKPKMKRVGGMRYWIKRGSISAIIVWAIATSAVVAAGRTAGSVATRENLINLTETALVDQIKCQRNPQVARSINAMLGNRIIRYVNDENGVYLFQPTARLTLFDLRVKHISGFDYEGFRRVPNSTMVGTAPPVFLEIDVEASTSELRKRATDAGLVEAVPGQKKRGFEISTKGLGSYLAADRDGVTSSIRCVAF